MTATRAQDREPLSERSGSSRWWLQAGGPVAVASVTLLTLQSPRSQLAQPVGDLGILAGALAATIACARAGAHGGPVARGWTGLAVAAALWTCAQVGWTPYGLSTAHALHRSCLPVPVDR